MPRIETISSGMCAGPEFHPLLTQARLPPTPLASGTVTDLRENVVRDTLLATGLVDRKSGPIDDTHSGLKFVRHPQDRPKK